MTVSAGADGTASKGIWLILLVSFAHGTTHLAGQGFYNLVPYIQQELQLDYVQVGAFGFIMQLSGFTANFIGAPLVDMTGRRVLMMAIALAVCAGALFLVGFASSFLIICFSLVVMGTCISSWHPPAISYLSGEFSKRRGFALAMHGSGASLGETLGPAIAGVLVATVAWRATTGWIALPMLIMSVVLLMTILPNDAVNRARNKAKGVFGMAEYLAGVKTMIVRPVIAGLCLVAALRAVDPVSSCLSRQRPGIRSLEDGTRHDLSVHRRHYRRTHHGRRFRPDRATTRGHGGRWRLDSRDCRPDTDQRHHNLCRRRFDVGLYSIRHPADAAQLDDGPDAT
jgi:MFS family permease